MHLRFEVLMRVDVISVFWDVNPCTLLFADLTFRRNLPLLMLSVTD